MITMPNHDLVNHNSVKQDSVKSTIDEATLSEVASTAPTTQPTSKVSNKTPQNTQPTTEKVNERSLFRVEFGETNGILQVAKRGFDTPTAEIELFEFIKGEIIYREIGNESLIIAGREFKTNDT